MIDIVDRLTAILHDADVAARCATMRLREASVQGDLTPIPTIQWVGKEYRFAANHRLCLFVKHGEDGWRLTTDNCVYPTTWSITVRGVLAELTRAVTRRNMATLLLIGAGLDTGITVDEWAALLARLAPQRPPVNPWLALPIAALPVAPSPATTPTPTPVPAQMPRRRRTPPAIPQPALFDEVA